MEFKELRGKNIPQGESSIKIRERVIRPGNSVKRFAEEGIFSNSAMSSSQIRKFCELDEMSESLLERAMVKQGFSARAHDRILKVARTIADLDDSEKIKPNHIGEAIGYRSLDKNYL